MFVLSMAGILCRRGQAAQSLGPVISEAIGMIFSEC